MLRAMRKLTADDSGMTSVEYALLLALIVVAGISAWQGLDTSVSNAAGRVANGMEQ